MKIERHLYILRAITRVREELHQVSLDPDASSMDKNDCYERLLTLYSCFDSKGLEQDIEKALKKEAA